MDEKVNKICRDNAVFGDNFRRIVGFNFLNEVYSVNVKGHPDSRYFRKFNTNTYFDLSGEKRLAVQDSVWNLGDFLGEYLWYIFLPLIYGRHRRHAKRHRRDANGNSNQFDGAFFDDLLPLLEDL